jgi:hypothetical protein
LDPDNNEDRDEDSSTAGAFGAGIYLNDFMRFSGTGGEAGGGGDG